MRKLDLLDFDAIALSLIGLLLAFTQMAHCQDVQPELVTSPQAFQDYMNQALPKVPAVNVASPRGRWTRADKIGFAANVALRAGDAAQTCLALHNGGHENWLPSQNCAVDAGLILLGIPTQYFAVRLAERTGRPKLARAILWAFPAGSAAAIASSSHNWNDPLPKR